jgi:hypothetical protein
MTTSQTDFVRRPNSDGTIDSICIRCQLTIATATWKADLDSAEQDHRDLFRLEHLRKSVKKSDETGESTERVPIKQSMAC